MGLAKPKQHRPRLRKQNASAISVREQVLADFGAFQQSGHWNPIFTSSLQLNCII